MVTMVWVVSRIRLKGPSWYLIFIYISPLTSLGQGSCTSWAPIPQKSATLSPQSEGKTTKFITGGGIGEEFLLMYTQASSDKNISAVPYFCTTQMNPLFKIFPLFCTLFCYTALLTPFLHNFSQYHFQDLYCGLQQKCK